MKKTIKCIVVICIVLFTCNSAFANTMENEEVIEIKEGVTVTLSNNYENGTVYSNIDLNAESWTSQVSVSAQVVRRGIPTDMNFTYYIGTVNENSGMERVEINDETYDAIGYKINQSFVVLEENEQIGGERELYFNLYE